MTMNDQSDEQAKQLPIVKTDVLGRIKIDPKHREAMLDAFELSGMSASAFALEHGVKQQTFASWIQKRRRARGDYDNEEIRKKLRMGTMGTRMAKKASQRIKQDPSSQGQALPVLPTLYFIELDTSPSPDQNQCEDGLEVRFLNGVSVKLQSESQVPLLKTLIQSLEC